MAQLGDIISEAVAQKVEEQVKNHAASLVSKVELQAAIDEFSNRQKEDEKKPLADLSRRVDELIAKERRRSETDNDSMTLLQRRVRDLFETETKKSEQEQQKLVSRLVDSAKSEVMTTVTEMHSMHAREIASLRVDLQRVLAQSQQDAGHSPPGAIRAVPAEEPACEALPASAAQPSDRAVESRSITADHLHLGRQASVSDHGGEGDAVTIMPVTSDGIESVIANAEGSPAIHLDSVAETVATLGVVKKKTRFEGVPTDDHEALVGAQQSIAPSMTSTATLTSRGRARKAAGSNADQEVMLVQDAGPSSSQVWEDAIKYGPAKSAVKGVRRTLYTIMLVLGMIAATCVLLLWTFPTFTITFVLVMALWLMYLCGEEGIIRTVSGRSMRNNTGPATRGEKMLFYLVGALRAVQSMRSSHEQETWMKSLLYSLTFLCIVFTPDSGIPRWLFVAYGVPMAWAIIISVAFLTMCFSYLWVSAGRDRSLRRGQRTGSESTPWSSQAVQDTMTEISHCLQGRGWASNQAQSQRINQILATSDRNLLNDLLEQMHDSREISLERVIGHCKDTVEAPSRTELIDMLFIQRGRELTVRAKYALIHALMNLRLSSCQSAEAAVADLLLGTYGDDLTQLKCMQDGQGHVNSTYKLIFEDMTDEKLRSDLLSHILQQGIAQVTVRTLMENKYFRELHRNCEKRGCLPLELEFLTSGFTREEEDEEDEGSAEAEERPRPTYGYAPKHNWRKVLTDIDDTIISSGGRFPAGMDNRYPRKSPYPGVTAFLRELHGEEATGQLIALSARPHIPGEMMEQNLFSKFSHMMTEYNLHTMPALLTGDMHAGGQFLFGGGSEEGLLAMGRKKYENFVQYMKLYPEFRYVFVGDSGQADYACAKMMLRASSEAFQPASYIEQVFIHQVQPPDKTWGWDETDAKQYPQMVFFENYIHASIIAVTRTEPLFDGEGLRRVVVAAVDDFNKIGKASWASVEARDTEAIQMNKYITEAIKVLQSLDLDADLPFIEVDEEKYTKKDFDDNHSEGTAGSGGGQGLTSYLFEKVKSLAVKNDGEGDATDLKEEEVSEDGPCEVGTQTDLPPDEVEDKASTELLLPPTLSWGGASAASSATPAGGVSSQTGGQSVRQSFLGLFKGKDTSKESGTETVDVTPSKQPAEAPTGVPSSPVLPPSAAAGITTEEAASEGAEDVVRPLGLGKGLANMSFVSMPTEDTEERLDDTGDTDLSQDGGQDKPEVSLVAREATPPLPESPLKPSPPEATTPELIERLSDRDKEVAELRARIAQLEAAAAVPATGEARADRAALEALTELGARPSDPTLPPAPMSGETIQAEQDLEQDDSQRASRGSGAGNPDAQQQYMWGVSQVLRNIGAIVKPGSQPASEASVPRSPSLLPDEPTQQVPPMQQVPPLPGTAAAVVDGQKETESQPQPEAEPTQDA
eukprot:TRINITY_DN34895_c0_g1_i1.p1 TRINITY_DN34895_c0_g1~~TRINITY_DN34895_c0_g1_i1.p1  ORF type:complete len:1436 (+),score=338.05 TRINITY_DN34895_c0_g1_i1:128-4435(+)